jgi:hypothetical protein
MLELCICLKTKGNEMKQKALLKNQGLSCYQLTYFS